MEDVLAVYTRPHDPDCPLVCVDESSKQLLAETRVAIPMKPGRPARFDYEYERNGTANLFMMFAPLEGWRHVKVTDRHTAVDYAHVLKDLADLHFACQSASKIDPASASNFDPLERRVLAVALAPSELAGVAEMARARVGVWSSSRLLKRQESLPVSTISQ